MSRFSVLGDDRRVRLPDASLGQPGFDVPRGPTLADGMIAGAGAIGEGLERRGRMQAASDAWQAEQLEKQRAMEAATQFGELQVRGVRELRGAREAAAKGADVDESSRLFIEALAPLGDEVKAITDPALKSSAQKWLGLQLEHGLVDVRADAARRVVDRMTATTQQQKAQLGASIADGSMSYDEARVAYGEMLDGMAEALGPKASHELAMDFDAFASRAEYNRLLSKSPAGAAAFLNRKEVQQALSSDEIGRRVKDAHAEQGEFDKDQASEALDTAKQIINDALLQDDQTFSPEKFRAVVDETVTLLTTAYPDEMKSVKGGGDANAVRMTLLGNQLEAAAKSLDHLRFDAIAAVLPKTAEGRILVLDQAKEFTRGAEQRVKELEAQLQVHDAVGGKLPLERNELIQSAIDQDAAEFAQAMISGGEKNNAKIEQAIADRYGPTTILPAAVVRDARSVVINAATAKPEQIAGTVDFLDYVRVKWPHAFRANFDAQTEAFITSYRERQIDGANPVETAKLVSESLNPTDPARSKEIGLHSAEIGDLNHATFVARAKTDWGVSLSTDERGHITAADLGEKIEPGVFHRFNQAVFDSMASGRSQTEAMNLAWANLGRTVGKTQVFTEPHVASFPPENFYGADNYGAREMETDLAWRLGLDAFDGSIIMPESMKDAALPSFSSTLAALALSSHTPDGADPRSHREGVQSHWIDSIREFARARLVLQPDANLTLQSTADLPKLLRPLEDSKAAPKGEAGAKPVYRVFIRDEFGALHPVMKKTKRLGYAPLDNVNVPGLVQAVEQGEDVGPYLIAPIYADGLTAQRRARRQQDDLAVTLDQQRRMRVGAMNRIRAAAFAMQETYAPWEAVTVP